MTFLREQFADEGLNDPADPIHGLDLRATAGDFALNDENEKSREGTGRISRGSARY
ncbi:hypothetical protein [Fulvimarina sp. MAC3]|uniref:hypothetical protein n=1 Tax=Fulvimarina sp. MAC3 TaxID=3148887 RepID=UPI0031FC8271